MYILTKTLFLKLKYAWYLNIFEENMHIESYVVLVAIETNDIA